MRYYLDTEFDGFNGKLMTLALVRDDGDSLYLVYDETCTDPWVRENVQTIIHDVPAEVRNHLHYVTHDEGAFLIAEFFAARGGGVPYIITDWPDDVRHLCQAIITGPGEMAPIPRLQFDVVRVDAYPSSLAGAVQHNAWWDAMALRQKLNLDPNPAAGEDGPSTKDRAND